MTTKATIDAKAAELLAAIKTLPDSREKSLALTNIEQGLHWADKAAAAGSVHTTSSGGGRGGRQ